MQNWKPDLSNSKGARTQAILDALRQDILGGTLKPNEQIPPLRSIASELGLNAATVKRAFDQAEKEGLIVRHVGKGTFVKAAPKGVHLPFQMNGEVLDLATNGPPAISNELLRQTLTNSILPLPYLDELFRYHKEVDYTKHRDALAFWINQHGLPVSSANIVITPGAQSAIVTALLATVGRNGTVAVEEMTYPGFISACRSLGIEVVSIRSDDHGPLPDDFREQLQVRPDISSFFVIPRAHNPTTRCISRERIHQLSDLAAKHNITIIEDDSYIGPRISEENPTFANTYPSGTYYLSGLSKILQPGLRIAYLVPPAHALPACQAIAQSLNYSVSPLLLELSRLWITDGTAFEIYNSNNEFFSSRHERAAIILSGFNISSNRQNAQIWMQLPEGWTSVSFTETARSEGIRVSAAESFLTTSTSSKCTHIRLCVGSVKNEQDFDNALRKIASLAHSAARFVQYDP
ncbi:PLP-dependent aminotransferase family protein [Litoreibacter sp.]|nr:PLP-dependent aminotransferase family protein [Litoreibacter sp.]